MTYAVSSLRARDLDRAHERSEGHVVRQAANSGDGRRRAILSRAPITPDRFAPNQGRRAA
jgi:hypothetical protein